MNYPKIPLAAALAGLALALFGPPCVYSYRHPQVILQDDGATPPNSCVVTACLATLKHPNSCVILVRYKNNGQGHAYCLWFSGGKFFASDWRGSVALQLKRGGVAGIAAALPVPVAGLIVESAEIIRTTK